MFVFYEMNDLILLNTCRILQNIEAPILVSANKLKNHVSHTIVRVKEIRDKGLITIKDQDDDCFDFVRSNSKRYPAAGNSLLALFHFCRQEHAILIVDEEELLVREMANAFDIKVNSLDEFNLATINNIEYFEFINEMKKEKKGVDK